jgi:hypothetical protein
MVLAWAVRPALLPAAGTAATGVREPSQSAMARAVCRTQQHQQQRNHRHPTAPMLVCAVCSLRGDPLCHCRWLTLSPHAAPPVRARTGCTTTAASRCATHPSLLRSAARRHNSMSELLQRGAHVTTRARTLRADVGASQRSAHSPLCCAHVAHLLCRRRRRRHCRRRCRTRRHRRLPYLPPLPRAVRPSEAAARSGATVPQGPRSPHRHICALRAPRQAQSAA